MRPCAAAARHSVGSISDSMSATAAAQPSPAHPFHDPSRGRRLVKIGAWLVGIALVVAVLQLLGVDVGGWLSDLWDQIKEVPPGYIVGALILQSGQTLFAGLSYYGILRAAYPGEGQVSGRS